MNCLLCESTGDDDEIKEINHHRIHFLIALDLPVTLHNDWLQGGFTLQLITLVDELLPGATRWCCV